MERLLSVRRIWKLFAMESSNTISGCSKAEVVGDGGSVTSEHIECRADASGNEGYLA